MKEQEPNTRIYLKNGQTIELKLKTWKMQKGFGALNGFEWTHDGSLRMVYIKLEEVVAIVEINEKTEEKKPDEKS